MVLINIDISIDHYNISIIYIIKQGHRLNHCVGLQDRGGRRMSEREIERTRRIGKQIVHLGYLLC
jgi:hypothetical protein